MKTCPSCGREFPDNVKFCPNDGQTLRAKAPSADLVGQVVADRYHIIKKLGEGGMGAVYLGEHVKMGRKSAIKVMAAAMAQDPDAISRFNREAANASRISHPSVCQIYDFGETHDGLIYLAMEFIEGQALTDLIEREGALDPPRAASVLKQAADALQAAHDLGIVHRDIKPDNIMVVQGRDGSDVVKVVDFGIARAVGGDEPGQKVTKTGLVVGTPEYMSPEQLAGDKLDGRSDIYSLGLVLYRMLTGVLPFQADSAQETMIKRLTDEPLPLTEARPDLVFPMELQRVMDRALARSSDERYQHAAEFGRDTMDAVAGMPTPQTRVDVAPTSAATQLMDTEAALAAVTRHQKRAAPPGRGQVPSQPPAPPPAPAKKRLPAAAIVGGAVLFVGAAAAIAVTTMSGGKETAATTGNDTATVIAAGSDTGPGGPAPPRQTDGRRTQSQTTTTVQPQPDTGTGRPEPDVRPAARPNWGDSLAAAQSAFDADDFAATRRLAEAVFNSVTSGDLKASAAVLMGSSYGAVGNSERAIQWYQRALPHTSGERRTRIENTIRSLGGQP